MKLLHGNFKIYQHIYFLYFTCEYDVIILFKYILSKGHVSVCEREKNERGERDHNILLSHSLHHKSYFSNRHSVVPAQREGGWNKDMKAMRKKKEKGRRRGELRQPGSVG